MFKTSFDGAALSTARTLAHVDELARDLWQAYGAGKLTDAEAENLAARIEDLRRELRPQDRTAVRAPHVLDLPRRTASHFPAKNKAPTSPDRAASKERRRRLAFSGPLPPALAARFTPGQVAVLRIVADEVRDKGACALPLGAIAARAGVCVTLARDAIRLAAGDGLLVIEERRQHRAPNKPNVRSPQGLLRFVRFVGRTVNLGRLSGNRTFCGPSPGRPKTSICDDKADWKNVGRENGQS
jgi:hypothetical protein